MQGAGIARGHVAPSSSAVAGRGAPARGFSQRWLGRAGNCPSASPGAGSATEPGLDRTHGARERGPGRPVPSLPAPLDPPPPSVASD